MIGHHYSRVKAHAGDAAVLAAAVAYFRREFDEGMAEISTGGRRLTQIEAELAGYVGYRFAQLQEIEAIFELLNVRYEAAKHEARKRYLEHYNRALSDNTANRYAENDAAVVALAEQKLDVEFVRNLFLGLTKAQEALNYQLSNITKLRVAAMEDASL